MCSGSPRLSLWFLSRRVRKPRHNRAKCRPTSTQSRSTRVLDVELITPMSNVYGKIVNWTHAPHMNDPLELPLASIIYVASRMFSPPLSPRTRDGKPHSLVDLMNPWRTISGKLFPETFIPVAYEFEKIGYFSAVGANGTYGIITSIH